MDNKKPSENVNNSKIEMVTSQNKPHKIPGKLSKAIVAQSVISRKPGESQLSCNATTSASCAISRKSSLRSVLKSPVNDNSSNIGELNYAADTFLQRHPRNKAEVNSFKYIYERVFSNLSVHDLKACRLVSKLWNENISYLLDKFTLFKFNCEEDTELLESTTSIVLKPWKLFVPPRADKFYEYLEESKNGLRYWSMMKILGASTADIKYIIDSDGSNLLFRDSVRGITTLELSSCTLDFSLLFNLLDCFPNLKAYHDIRNTFREPVPMYRQVLNGLTGGSASSETHVMEIDQEFIREFRKYKLAPNSLKIEDSGQGTTTSVLLYILPEVLIQNCLREVEIIAGAECSQHKGAAQKEARFFWVAVGELLLQFKSALKTLKIKCTKESSAIDSFDLFLNACTNYMSQATADDLIPLTHLTLDFKFLWINSTLFQTLLIPYIKRCTSLKHLKMNSIILKSKYEKRLEQLYPLSPICYYDLGVHLSDLELSDTPIPEMISLAESKLYQDTMRRIHFSVHSPETFEFRKFVKVNGVMTYDSLEEFTLTIMNKNFNSLSSPLLPLKFPSLTSIIIIDGPILNNIGRNFVTTEKITAHMSQLKLENDDLQLILESFSMLKNLHLQINMENVTDSGTTGIIQSTVNRLINHRDMMIHDPEYEIYGKSFGDLQVLESLALKGLGAQVSEVTAFFAFKGMRNLKNLLLYGKQRIGIEGKKFLYQALPQCNISIVD